MIAFWFEPHRRYIVEWDGSSRFYGHYMRNSEKVFLGSFVVENVKSMDEAYKHAADWVKSSPV